MPPAAILFCSCRKVWRKDTPKGAVPPLGIPPCCGGDLAFPQSRYGGNLYAKHPRPLPLPGVAAGGGGTGDVPHLRDRTIPYAALHTVWRDHWARHTRHSTAWCSAISAPPGATGPTKAAPARKRNARTKTQRVSDTDAKTAAPASMTSGRAGDSQGGASYKRPLGVSFLHTFLHEQKSMAAGGMTS